MKERPTRIAMENLAVPIEMSTTAITKMI